MNEKTYKTTIALSNLCYNEGLERAKSRDLSGAIEYLKMGVKYHKANTQARNLLGLVHYEMGELVEALSQWVISKSLDGKNNPAEAYITAVQADKNGLDIQNQAIKKYNQCLFLCKQGNWDMAGIQLKKVLNLNPHMVKGHQLLALISLHENKPEDAKRALKNASRIDGGNPLTRRYAQELKTDLSDEEPGKRVAVKAEKKNVLSYRSGNDTIIKPAHSFLKELSPKAMIVNIAVGVVMGAALMGLLVIPGMQQNVKSNSNQTLQGMNDTIGMKEQTISGMQKQVEDMKAETDRIKQEDLTKTEQVTTYENLLTAYAAHSRNDVAGAGTALEGVDPSKLSAPMQEIYNTIHAGIDAQFLASLYTEGKAAFDKGDYPQAVEKLQAAANIDERYQDGNVVYYLAKAYQKVNDVEKAAEYYHKVQEIIPAGTVRYKNAASFLKSIGQ